MNQPSTAQRNQPPALWEIEQRVLTVAANELDLPRQSISPTARLIEDLGLDSLALVEFMLALEEEFNVTIPDEAVTAVFTHSPVTLRDVAQLVRERWGTGADAQQSSSRRTWRQSRNAGRGATAYVEEMPFTQLGGLSSSEHAWRASPLYQPIGLNREGYEQYLRSTDGMRCVLIPAADNVWLGSSDPDAPRDHQPAHQVRLSAFFMDAEPVSNAAYARFLNSVGEVPDAIIAEWCGVDDEDRRGKHFQLHRTRKGWEPIPKTERHPMILVSWWGANAYSLWAHRRDWRLYRGDDSVPASLARVAIDADRDQQADAVTSYLPSEAQWEYAARGSGNKPHVPAGSQVSTDTAQVGCHALGASYSADSLPSARVSERLGMSPFGLHHMAGNVWQWCSDWYAPDFYEQSEALGIDPENSIVATDIRSERGGSWVGPAELAQPSYRRGRPPGARGRCLGFRCAASPEV